MRVLGIDPGSRVTGWGIVENFGNETVHVDSGGIFPQRKLPFTERLKYIYDGVRDLIEKYRPDTAAIEDVFVAKNVRSSLILGHARGSAMVAISGADIDISEYTPSQVKSALVGNGRATKRQVQKMIRILLKLEEPPFEDASDALAVAMCHINSLSFNRKLKESAK